MKVNRTIVVDLKEQNIFFTSDPHFTHEKIIEYCDRPFKTAREMDSTIIKNWNNVVGKEDVIVVGGDFCFGGVKQWTYLLENLNGIKYITWGNHDRVNTQHWEKRDNILNFRILDDEIDGGEQRITVCHYPMLSWYLSHKGSWQLYGHLHGKLTNQNLGDGKYDIKSKIISRQLDIGVDVHNFTPISYEEVKTIITKQSLK